MSDNADSQPDEKKPYWFDDRNRTFTSEGFRVVGNNKKVLAALELGITGPHFQINREDADTEAECGISMGTTDDGSRLTLFDDKGRHRISLHGLSSASGGVGIELFDQGGNVMAAVCADESGLRLRVLGYEAQVVPSDDDDGLKLMTIPGTYPADATQIQEFLDLVGEFQMVHGGTLPIIQFALENGMELSGDLTHLSRDQVSMLIEAVREMTV